MKKILPLIAILMLFLSCEKEFLPEFDTLTDSRDNVAYELVTLGSQTWFAENLKYLPEVHEWNNGSGSQPRYHVNAYDGTDVLQAKDLMDYEIYGVFYNYPATSNACPDGWRLPTEDDWKELRKHVGRRNGEALRSTDLWVSSMKGNNLSGLNLRPFPHGEDTRIWSTGQPTDVEGRHYFWGFLEFYNQRFNHGDAGPEELAYIRCIKVE